MLQPSSIDDSSTYVSSFFSSTSCLFQNLQLVPIYSICINCILPHLLHGFPSNKFPPCYGLATVIHCHFQTLLNPMSSLIDRQESSKDTNIEYTGINTDTLL